MSEQEIKAIADGADIIEELISGILDAMHDNVMEIILYGSVARKTDTPESDVDIAILVNRSMNAEEEDRLSDFAVEMNLKYDRVFSMIDIDYEQFLKWENSLPFYKNVRDEGVELWRAA